MHSFPAHGFQIALPTALFVLTAGTDQADVAAYVESVLEGAGSLSDEERLLVDQVADQITGMVDSESFPFAVLDGLHVAIVASVTEYAPGETPSDVDGVKQEGAAELGLTGTLDFDTSVVDVDGGFCVRFSYQEHVADATLDYQHFLCETGGRAYGFHFSWPTVAPAAFDAEAILQTFRLVP